MTAPAPSPLLASASARSAFEVGPQVRGLAKLLRVVAGAITLIFLADAVAGRPWWWLWPQLVAVAAALLGATVLRPGNFQVVLRALCVAGTAFVAWSVWTNTSPVGLGYFVVLLLFAGFTEFERRARWLLMLLIAGAAAATIPRIDFALYGEWSAGRTQVAALFEFALLVGLVFVEIQHFTQLNRAVYTAARDRAAAATAALAEAEAGRAALAERREALLRAQRSDLRAVQRHRGRRAAIHARREALEQFAYAASHDLKEPVRTIRSFMQVARKRLGPTLAADPELGEYFDHVAESSRAMHDVLESLLDYSRATRAEPSPRRIDLVVCAEAAADAAAIAAVRVEAVGCGVAEAHADPIAVGRVLAALLANAAAFAPPEAPVTIRVACGEREGEVVVRVIDRGPGIPEGYRDRAFGMFARLCSRAEGAGAGLGLALVRRLAAEAGGRAWLECTEGGGTTAAVSLPEATEQHA